MGYNLLIVDDSSIIRKSLRKALGMTQLEIGNIFEAGNGQEALQVLGEQWIDLVFLDINMPVMNGMEFMKKIREDAGLKNIPVLIISTEGSKVRYAELEALGIMGTLRKPVRPELLAETVTAILGEIKHE